MAAKERPISLCSNISEQVNLIRSFVRSLSLLSFATIDFGQLQFFLVAQPNVTWEVSAVCKCMRLCVSVWVFFRRLFVFYKLRSPRDSACKKRAHQNEIYREKKYFDELSANLHLPEETFALFATQTHFNFISVVLRTKSKTRENT